MQISNMYKCFEEELSTNIGAYQPQLDGVDYGVYAVNVFHSLSVPNISVERICKDQMRPHLLGINQTKKQCTVKKKRLNLMYFATADFH